MRHCNIPIFIPHLGCPNQCVFCNQRSISGKTDFAESNVQIEIERALETVSPEDTVEIAFFGGSFTGIDRELMLRLLQTAQAYVDCGRVHSIRLSTRPDYLSDEILEILSRFSVRTIELGLQSMDDGVLCATKRGHTAADAVRAIRAVKNAGFSPVGQMMIGLPQSTPQSERETAQMLAELGVDAVRIYPTVVFYGTPLADMTASGAYTPLSIEDAVKRTADVLELFCERGIPCLRIGLCASEALTSPAHVMAGPNHPALGELVMSECMYRKILQVLADANALGKRVILHVPETEISRAIGQHRCNLHRLQRETETQVTRVRGDAAEITVTLCDE